MYVLASGTASMLDGGGSGDRAEMKRVKSSSTLDVMGADKADRAGLRRVQSSSNVMAAAMGLPGSDVRQQPRSASPKLNKVEQGGGTKLPRRENSIRGRSNSPIPIDIESTSAERRAERRAAEDDKLAAKIVRESSRMKLSLQLDTEDVDAEKILEEKEDGTIVLKPAATSHIKMDWKKAAVLTRAASSRSLSILPDVKGAKDDESNDSSSVTHHPPAPAGDEDYVGGGGGGVGGGGGWGLSSMSRSKSLWKKLKSSIVSQSPVISRQPGSWTWDSIARDDAERKFQEDTSSSGGEGGVVLHTLSKARPSNRFTRVVVRLKRRVILMRRRIHVV